MVSYARNDTTLFNLNTTKLWEVTKMYDMMKKQNFGVEIELTGITREQAANVIATYFGTQAHYLGTYYKTYGATDRKGRTWKAMPDGSILTERKSASHGRVSAGTAFSCEVVTPVLQYEDMDDLQNIIRALREAGAIANSSCGIHVHVDGKNHTPRQPDPPDELRHWPPGFVL